MTENRFGKFGAASSAHRQTFDAIRASVSVGALRIEGCYNRASDLPPDLIMEKTLDRRDISDVLVKFIQGFHVGDLAIPISEETAFGVDIPNDKGLKEVYYYGIRVRLEELGYEFFNFSLKDCEEAETIGDIIDAVWSDVSPESRTSM